VTSSENAPQNTEATDPEAGPELARLVSLLQSLPDPPTPEGLTERVMAEVRRREARPRVLRVAFRTVFQPGVATALAAGLACLVVFVGVRGAVAPGEAPAAQKLVPSRARPIEVAGDRFGPPARNTLPLVADPVGLFVDDLPPAALPRTGISPVVAVNDVLSQRLDRQLNRLLLDPRSFYRQIERHSKGDLVVARLADRAAERGDAIGVALRLRETAPRDPITHRFIEKLFGAVLEQSLPKH
jgi:hypothetical protein